MTRERRKKAVGEPVAGRPSEAAAMPHEKERRIISRVYELGEPLCEAEGMELVCVEYQREPHGRVLRLYLDKPGGVTLNDCASFSRQIGDILDVALDDAGAYSLEVSSPGPNRPLGKRRDFIKYQGNTVEIRVSQELDGKKKFKGILEGMSEDTVHLRTKNATLAIPYERIVRARLVN